MKKNSRRIFGRQVARELEGRELRHVTGGLVAPDQETEPQVKTWTTSYPPDSDPKNDGPIWA